MASTQSQSAWRETKLGDIAEIVKDAWKPSDEKQAYVGLEHINEQELALNGVGSSDGLESNKFRFKAGDILFGKLRPYFRKVVVPSFDGVCSTDIWVIRAKQNNDQRFLFYFMANPVLIDKSMGASTGSRMPRADWNFLSETYWNVPEQAEQRAIAAILSSLDDKIELLQAQNKTLEEMAQRLFKEWFVDFNFPNENGEPYKKSGGKMVESEYGEIPEGWKTKSYSDLVNVLSGGTPKTDVPEYWNGQIPFFTPKDAKDTFYVDTTEKYITKAGLSACNSKLYPKDTVFITARGTVGKCALALRDMAMNQSCYALVGKDISNLFVFLLTKQLIDVIKKSASGAVFDAITVSTFNSLHVALGDRQVTDRFEALIRPMFNKIANNTEEIFKLAELRDELLPKLMNGEITFDRE